MGLHQRVLISNRGEIAIRIAEAAASLGIESVAVYAPVDAASLHTKVATEARQLASAADGVAAYLDIDAVIDVATTACAPPSAVDTVTDWRSTPRSETAPVVLLVTGAPVANRANQCP